jgi:hypothetical protein
LTISGSTNPLKSHIKIVPVAGCSRIGMRETIGDSSPN